MLLLLRCYNSINYAVEELKINFTEQQCNFTAVHKQSYYSIIATILNPHKLSNTGTAKSKGHEFLL
jgi:ribonucleotide reductase beta subunit family protein with ferritin-like domain